MLEPTEEEGQKAIQSIQKRQEYMKQYYQANKEKAQEYYQNNKEKVIERSLRRYDEHKEEIHLQRRQYNVAHKGEIAEYGQQWYQANKGRVRKRYEERKEEIAECKRRYHLANAERIRMCERLYSQEHPEVHRNANRKRRALKLDAEGNFTDEEFQLLCEAFENKCIYCHKEEELPLAAEHMTPLSRGGSNDISNIVPSCASCNAKKGTKTYDEYIKQLAEVF